MNGSNVSGSCLEVYESFCGKIGSAGMALGPRRNPNDTYLE